MTFFTLLFLMCTQASALQVGQQEWASGFEQITDFQFVPGEPSVLLVLEKEGKLKRHDLKTKKTTVILLLKNLGTHSELGLLGLAFHPDFNKNKKIYLNTTPKNPKTQKESGLYTRVAEWTYSEKGLDPKTEKVLFEIKQPYSNHNGGQIVFGPDRKLYVGMGDGGSANDPQGNGQNPKSLLGKMLRIDVDQKNAQPEIYASGLRNPWRFSFTPQGKIIAADVGQNSYEEVTYVEMGSNLGWNTKEGFHCFKTLKCDETGLTDPIVEYGREVGQSITGGFVYTGRKIRELAGKYIFGDFGSGMIAALDLGTKKFEVIAQTKQNISTFARDPEGEVYYADFGTGKIYQLTSGPNAQTPSPKK